jgi:hypothetical protein
MENFFSVHYLRTAQRVSAFLRVHLDRESERSCSKYAYWTTWDAHSLATRSPRFLVVRLQQVEVAMRQQAAAWPPVVLCFKKPLPADPRGERRRRKGSSTIARTKKLDPRREGKGVQHHSDPAAAEQAYFTGSHKFRYSLRPILLFANTDISTTKICLNTSTLAKSIMDRRE